MGSARLESCSRMLSARGELSVLQLDLGDGVLLEVDQSEIILVGSPSEEESARVAEGAQSALAAHLNHCTVLHGASVVVGEAAWAFLGESGAGKSTLAAFLCRSGARLLSDGFVAVSPDGLVAPNRSGFRLSDAVIESLGLGVYKLGSKLYNKWRVRVTEWEAASPVRLNRVFILGQRANEGRLFSLLRHAYWVEWMSVEAQAELMGECERLASNVQCEGLAVPRGLDQLAPFAQMLVSHKSVNPSLPVP